MPSWLALFLPSLIIAYQCNYLPPKYKRITHKYFASIKEKIVTLECNPQSADNKSLYACYTRVDMGEIHMGCYDRRSSNTLRDLCRESLWETMEKCDYDKNTPMGAFHSRPGQGMCCCTGNRCNQLPPYWLLTLSREELTQSVWLRDLHYLFFILITVIVGTLLFILAAVIQHFTQLCIIKLKLSKERGSPQKSNDGPLLYYNYFQYAEETPKDELSAGKQTSRTQCDSRDNIMRTQISEKFSTTQPDCSSLVQPTPKDLTLSTRIPDATQKTRDSNLHTSINTERTQCD